MPKPKPPFPHVVKLVLLLGLAVRLIYSLSVHQIYYADSLFQILEPAHRLVYGYGLIAPEYQLGMRHWLLPGIVAGILKLLSVLHLTEPRIYVPVVKVFFILLSLFIPILGYQISRHLTSKSSLSLITLIILTFWYEFIYFSAQPFYEIMATYTFLLVVLFILQSHHTSKKAFLVGAALGLGANLRPQYLLVSLCLLLLGLKHTSQRKSFLGGVILSTLGMGFIDQLTWGSWWHSASEHLGRSLSLGPKLLIHTPSFGDQPWWYYLSALLITSGGLVIFSLPKLRYPSPLTIIILSTVIPYSLIAHKEYRYIFLALPLLLITSIHSLSELLSKRGYSPAQVITYPLRIFLVISLLGLVSYLPYQSKYYPTFLKSSPIISVYQKLSPSSNICGLFDSTRFWMTSAGYFYLHQPIPLYDLSYLPPDSSYINTIISKSNIPPLHDYQRLFEINSLYVYTNFKSCTPPPQYTYHRQVPESVFTPTYDPN